MVNNYNTLTQGKIKGFHNNTRLYIFKYLIDGYLFRCNVVIRYQIAELRQTGMDQA